MCCIGKKIPLENLNYWNVDLQEPYFSFVEANQKRKRIKKFISICYELISIEKGFQNHLF